MQLGNRVELLGAIRFEFLLGAFLSLTAIVTLLGSSSPSTSLKAPVLFYFSIVIFYTVFTYDFDASWKTFFDRTLKFSMLAFFISTFVRDAWAVKMAIGAFLLAMLKITSEGFLGWIGGGLVWESQGIPRLHGATMLYRHPNSFSGLAVGCIPFIYYLFPVASKIQKLALSVLLVFVVVVIVFTGSRSGYVATVLLILYFWWEREGIGKFKYLIVACLGLLFLLPLLPQEYIGRFISIYTLEEAEGSSGEARITIIKDAIQVFLTHPWGVGVGAFPDVRMEMFGRSQDTHNLYFELLTNMSIFGIGSFLYLVYRIIEMNRRLQKKLISFSERGIPNSRFLLCLSKAIVAFVIARLFLGLFGMDTYEIYWWFAVGFSIAIYHAVDQLETGEPTSAGQLNKPDTVSFRNRKNRKGALGPFPNAGNLRRNNYPKGP